MGIGDRERGLAMGRVMAHEMITHQLLARNNDVPPSPLGHTRSGITSTNWNAKSLFNRGTGNAYNLSRNLRDLLNSLCLPADPQAPTPPTYAGGGGGGDNGGYTGGGGYPYWYYSMLEFLDWIDSIPVGRPTHVEVRIVDDKEAS